MEHRKVLTFIKEILPVVFIIVSAVISRIIPHPPNFTPIGGIALFSGAYLVGFRSFLFPLLIMFVSDLFLGFHSTLAYVYISFVLIVLLGKLLKKKKSFLRLAATSILSSVLFFIITNFGVWQATNMYPKSTQGLVQSYLMGIPFFKNTLIGDLFYTFLLFYGVAYAATLARKMLLDFSKKREYR